MGAWHRERGERLRAKYSRMFGVPLEDVVIEEFIDEDEKEDARVFAKGAAMLPTWTVGTYR